MEPGLLLGLDGVDYGFLDSHRGELPVLDDVFTNHASGRLRSTIPPATSAAWTSGLSGMSTARTGVTDFGADSSAGGVVDSRDVRTPRLWDVVEANGGESVVIGVPVTYPAVRIDGSMLTGFLSPSDDGRFHPPELEAEIDDDYEFYLNYAEFGPRRRDEYLERLYASTDAKFDLVERAVGGDLPGTVDPDLVCFVLSEPDWIQHFFRKQPADDNYRRGEEVVSEFLRHVDERVGRLLDASEGPVALMSDHGFGKYTTKHVFLNQWLAGRDDLTLRDSSGAGVRQFVGRNARKLLRVPGARYLKHFAPDTIVGEVSAAMTLSDDDVDWSQTRARFRQVFNNTGYVEVNEACVDDREAFVGDLVGELRGLRDPDTGDALVDEVHRREEYYRGPAVEEMPDIVLVWEDEYSGNELPGGEFVSELSPSERPPPAHAMDGFYAFVGDEFTSTDVDLHIQDVAPTLYRAMGVPLPAEVDGRVAEETLSDSVPDSSGSRRYVRNDDFVTESNGPTDEVERRLEDLGYR